MFFSAFLFAFPRSHERSTTRLKSDNHQSVSTSTFVKWKTELFGGGTQRRQQKEAKQLEKVKLKAYKDRSIPAGDRSSLVGRQRSWSTSVMQTDHTCTDWLINLMCARVSDWSSALRDCANRSSTHYNISNNNITIQQLEWGSTSMYILSLSHCHRLTLVTNTHTEFTLCRTIALLDASTSCITIFKCLVTPL